MSEEAARYLRRLAREQGVEPAPAPLTASELEAALQYAKQVRAPIVALEELQDALTVARYDEEAGALEHE